MTPRPNRIIAAALIVLATHLVAASMLVAQNAGWDTRFGPAPMTNGGINAVLVHDGVVYVGGAFTVIDDVPAARVARWDARIRRWAALGRGVDGEVHDLAVRDGHLYVAGTFASADSQTARGIARYDLRAGTWSPVGDPAQFANTGGANRGFFCLLSRPDGVYAGGNLTLTSGERSSGVFRYNPDAGTWAHLGGGVDTLGTVSALAAMGDRVAVGGYFRWVGRPALSAASLAVYDPVADAWSAIPQGVRGTVNALAVLDSTLWVGGAFDTLNGRSTNLAVWDDRAGARRWLKVGSGVGGFTRVVSSLAHDGRTVHVGLRLFAASDQPVLYEVNPTTLAMTPSSLRPNGDVRDVVVDAGRLLVTGAFEFLGPHPYRRIAVRDLATGEWSTFASHLYLAPSGAVHALALDGRGGMVVGGAFQWVGFDVANNVAIWDGERWASLAGGVNGTVRAVAVDGDSIYVGGDFTAAGGVPAAYIARYDRTTGTWSSIGEALDGPVHAILIGPSRTVFVGGEFTHAGEMLARGVALWSGRWWGLGVGPTNGVDGTVRALAIVGRSLYVGGTFVSGGGNPDISHLARWNLDSPGWTEVGDGVDNSITALHATGGSLIVAGPIGRAGTVVTRGVARWDGVAWHALGAGLGGERPVYAITSHGQYLVAAGGFSSSGTTPLNRLAIYNGVDWRDLGGGLSANGSALASLGGSVFVGGEFRTVGGGIGSDYLGVWQGTAGVAQERVTREAALTLRPNPAAGTVELSIAGSHAGATCAVIVDALGVERRRVELASQPDGDARITIDLDGLAPGAYLVHLIGPRAAAGSRERGETPVAPAATMLFVR